MKTFALHRLRDVTIQSGKPFKPRKLNLEKHLGGAFGIKNDGKEQQVVIDFGKNISRRIRERLWHESQQFEDTKGGGVRMTMQVSDLEFVCAWVLGWGADAKVVQPARLRKMIREKARATADLYGD